MLHWNLCFFDTMKTRVRTLGVQSNDLKLNDGSASALKLFHMQVFSGRVLIETVPVTQL